MKPTALEVIPENIPESLKLANRWVCWRYEKRKEDRWAKILCQTNGRHAKSNDPSTWTDFIAALASHTIAARGFDGIGFCLGDGWAGVDLDHAVIENDYTEQQIRAVDDHLATLRDANVYIELSPSGKGYKAIGSSSRIGGEVNFAAQPPVKTTWAGARFFTITGQSQGVCDCGTPTADLTGVIDAWFPTVKATPSRTIASAIAKPDYIRDSSRGLASFNQRSDRECLLAAATATNRLKFLKLFRGDISDYGDDRSRAEQALVNILVYWSNGDLDQADRMFRVSNLYRDKWETRSYRISTLQKAVRLFAEALA